MFAFHTVKARLQGIQCVLLAGEAFLKQGDAGLVAAALFIQPLNHACSLIDVHGIASLTGAGAPGRYQEYSILLQC